MSENYVEEEHIGKAIMQEFFTKTRLTEKQPGHRLFGTANSTIRGSYSRAVDNSRRCRQGRRCSSLQADTPTSR
eukprot:2361027-Amphidinium_carterae.1